MDAMGVLSGELVEIYLEDGKTVGVVRVGRATTRVAMMLLMNAKVGDSVMIYSGIALSKINGAAIRN